LWGENNLAKGRMLQNRISKSLKMASLQAYSVFLRRSGSTKLSTLARIAEALDFDPKDLLT